MQRAREVVCVCALRHGRLFCNPWTVAARFLCPCDFPGKNIGVGCPAIRQEIFPTQGANPCFLHLLHWEVDSFTTVPPGKPHSATW